MLEVRLLGGFGVKRGKTAVSMSSRPAQSLFAFLILNAGAAFRREKLAGLFWGDSTEEGARDYLRHALWRIRKALHAVAAEHYVQADDLTARFDATADYWLDAAALRDVEENAPAAELMKVLAAYKGELLPGFYDEWVVLEREHLQAVFERHMERLLRLLQESGEWGEVLKWGEQWIAQGQKPEASFRHLMVAHAARGDMAKAAATYERCAKSLAEYGVEPSDQTRQLYDDIKAGKEVTPAPVRPSRAEQAGKGLRNVPSPLTSFIGREQETAEIIRLIDEHKVVTLTGPGGVGKTRLAIHVANKLQSKFVDGILWIELAPIADPSLVPQVIAGTLNLQVAPGQSPAEAVTQYLRSKRLLLILDSCEHLILACAEIIELLAGACPNLKILSTSREAMGILGERVHEIPTLSLPEPQRLGQGDVQMEYESTRLFVERAQAVRPDFRLTTQNAASVYQICRRLDGIPLALELAAARTKLLTVENLAGRLDDRFNLLTQGSRTALPRHQTLRAMVDWSYDQLPEDAGILFRRLSIFAGGFTVEAAEAICSEAPLSSEAVVDLLARLVDRSLVRVSRQGHHERFRMLETIREYGLEKLSESGEGERVRNRHLDFVLALADKAEPRIFTGEGPTWLDRLDAELDNLRAALEWAQSLEDAAAGLRLAGSVYWFWWVRGYWHEGRKWQRAALAKPGAEIRTKWRAKALTGIGYFLIVAGEYVEARAVLEESAGISREIGDRQGRAVNLAWLGRAIGFAGDYLAARTVLEESLALSREFEYKIGIGLSLLGLGANRKAEGNFEDAQRLLTEAVAALKGAGDKNFASFAVRRLGYLALHQGDHGKALDLCVESLTVNAELGDQQAVAASLVAIACIASEQGDVQRAARLYGASAAMMESLAPLFPEDEIEHEPYLRAAITQMGQEKYAVAFGEGRAMAMEQAIEYALAERPISL